MSKEINDKGLENEAEETQSRHFIQNFIDEDIALGRRLCRYDCTYPFPTRTEWFLTHRSR